MKAVITHGQGQLNIQNVDMPQLDDYDALVKMEACLFCNSTDRHLVEGTFPFAANYPAILGHESVGIVQQVGKKVRTFSEGDRVLRAYALWPDETLNGYQSLWGGFAEYGKVKDTPALVEDGLLNANDIPGHFRYQQIVPPKISFNQSLLMIGQKEIYSSIAQFEKIAGKKFLVLGAGITALLYGTFLKIKGAAHVTLVARRQAPLDFALQQNAADSVSLLNACDTLCHDYDALIETTGNLEAAATALQAVSPGGIVYSYAIYPGMANESLFDSLKKNHTFMRVDPVEHSAHDDVCQLLIDGSLTPDPFITHTFPFDDIQSAWKTVVDKVNIKTAVLF